MWWFSLHSLVVVEGWVGLVVSLVACIWNTPFLHTHREREKEREREREPDIRMHRDRIGTSLLFVL